MPYLRYCLCMRRTAFVIPAWRSTGCRSEGACATAGIAYGWRGIYQCLTGLLGCPALVQRYQEQAIQYGALRACRHRQRQRIQNEAMNSRRFTPSPPQSGKQRRLGPKPRKREQAIRFYQRPDLCLCTATNGLEWVLVVRK